MQFEHILHLKSTPAHMGNLFLGFPDFPRRHQTCTIKTVPSSNIFLIVCVNFPVCRPLHFCVSLRICESPTVYKIGIITSEQLHIKSKSR